MNKNEAEGTVTYGTLFAFFGEAVRIVKLVADKKEISEEDQECAQILMAELKAEVGAKALKSFLPS